MFTSYWTSYGLRQFLTIAVTVRNLTDFHVSNRCLLPLAPLPACGASACCSILIIGRGCWWCCLVRWASPRGGVRTGSDGRGRYLGRWASAWAGRLANSGKCSEPTADGGCTPAVRRPGRAGCEPESTTSKPCRHGMRPGQPSPTLKDHQVRHASRGAGAWRRRGPPVTAVNPARRLSLMVRGRRREPTIPELAMYFRFMST